MPASFSVEVEGMMETLKAFRGLDADLRNEANAELREAAGQCAGGLAADLVAAATSSGVPVAPKVARTVRVRRDRIPVVSIGGGKAAPLLWGSEQGPKSDPNRFAVDANPAGYWIAPTVDRWQQGPSIDVYRRAVYDLMKRHRLV